MKIGLLSDTHGSLENIENTVETYQDYDLEFLIHTGDVTKYDHLRPLFRLGRPIHLAIGNMDRNPDQFQQAGPDEQLTVHGSAGRLEVRDWTIGFTHGHYDSFIRQFKRENVDYIVRGHTHERTDDRRNGTRIINPGAVKPPSGSAALLDLSQDELTYFDL